MNQLADALLEAHVQHMLGQWRGDSAARSIPALVSSLFEWFGQVTLDQVATPAQVMGVIQRQVIDRRVSGGITELIGELSQLVFSSPRSATTRLDEVLADDEYQEFADKVCALEGVRRELIAMIAHSEAFALFRSRVIVHAISALALPWGRLRGLTGDALPAFEQRVARALTQHFGGRASAARDAERELLELIDPEWLHSLIDEIWAAVAPAPLADAFALIGTQDLEDFVVLGYEFWLRYRKSDYFRQITEETVNYFFTKFGRLTLLELLDELGVTEPMVVQELQVFLSPLLDQAERTGFLEQQIRNALGSFYRSPAAAAILHGKTEP